MFNFLTQIRDAFLVSPRKESFYQRDHVQIAQDNQVAKHEAKAEPLDDLITPEGDVLVAGVPHKYAHSDNLTVIFKPSFESVVCVTEFGTKILPEGVPEWVEVAREEGDLKQAIEKFIEGRSKGDSYPRTQGKPTGSDSAKSVDEISAAGSSSNASADKKEISSKDRGQITSKQPSAARNTPKGNGNHKPYTGILLSWGEQDFPDSKRPGKTYRNFAIKLELDEGGESVLQGEGLKDAIADCGGAMGDHVTVRRLQKVKVPAFEEGTGTPKLDANGDQILWDKWLWSMTKI